LAPVFPGSPSNMELAISVIRLNDECNVCSAWVSKVFSATCGGAIDNWLVLLTILKHISQLGFLFPYMEKYKNVPNHQPDKYIYI